MIRLYYIQRLVNMGFLSSLKDLLVPDLSFFPEKAVVLDLETTGLSAPVDDIIEVAIIKTTFFRSGNDEYYSRLVLPTINYSNALDNHFLRESAEYTVPTEITKLTGITSQELRVKGIPTPQMLREVEIFIGDLPIIAHNAKFDMRFLRNKAMQNGIKDYLKKNEVICTLEMAKRALPYEKSYKLADLSGGKQKHRALSDCKLTKRLYEKCMIILRPRK